MINPSDAEIISEVISKSKQCCYNTPTKLMFYDMGKNQAHSMLVCEDHFKQKPFQRFAITLSNGSNFVDVSNIFIKIENERLLEERMDPDFITAE